MTVNSLPVVDFGQLVDCFGASLHLGEMSHCQVAQAGRIVLETSLSADTKWLLSVATVISGYRDRLHLLTLHCKFSNSLINFLIHMFSRWLLPAAAHLEYASGVPVLSDSSSGR